MKLSLVTLYTVSTVAHVLAFGLQLARDVGLPVDSWRTGDPTRSLYKYLAEQLVVLDTIYADYVRSGFLSTATGEWLRVLAFEVYGVEAQEATFASSTITLTNLGGGHYELDAGDLVVRNTATDKTYTSDAAVVIAAGSTVSVSVVADEAGSDSSAAVDEIDAVVAPTLLGVAVTASTAAVAQDEQSDESIREQCEESTGALSPNGPPDAYRFVVRNPALTGATDITRAQTIDDADTGDVTVYVGGPSGSVAAGSVTAAQNAIDMWATPQCITATVVNATPVEIDVTASISGSSIPAGFEATIEAALASVLASLDIGGDVYRSRLIHEIHKAVPQIETLTLTVPAADVTINNGQAPVIGTVSVSEV